MGCSIAWLVASRQLSYVEILMDAGVRSYQWTVVYPCGGDDYLIRRRR